MALTIDADLITDFEDIDPKVIAYCITLHQKQLKRFDQLSDYYDGKHEIFNRKMDSENAKNVKVMVNNAKVVTDMMVGFSGGNPVGYAAAKDKNIDAVLDVYEEIDIATHDIEMLKDLSVFGVAYELHYIRIKPDQEEMPEGESPEIEPRIKAVDPRGIFLVTDDTLERNKLFACHYYKKYDLDGAVNGYQVDVYTRKRINKYKAKDLSLSEGNYEKAPPIETFYNSVPVIEIRNNEEKQGDFEQQISLIDAYNLLQSDRIADKEAFIDSILFLYGFTIQEDEDGNPKPLVKNGVISAPSTGGEDGAKAEWLTKAFVEKDVQVLSRSIEDDIHKTTYVPNLNDEKFGGTISGKSLPLMLEIA